VAGAEIDADQLKKAFEGMDGCKANFAQSVPCGNRFLVSLFGEGTV